MELSKYSRNRIYETFVRWDVPKDFADPMYNYLVHGFPPGSCFTAILANDFTTAIRSSHPVNTVEALKALSGWIQDTVPLRARGNYDLVNLWCMMSDSDRRALLEELRLVYTEKEELVLILKDERTVEPHLW